MQLKRLKGFQICMSRLIPDAWTIIVKRRNFLKNDLRKTLPNYESDGCVRKCCLGEGKLVFCFADDEMEQKKSACHNLVGIQIGRLF